MILKISIRTALPAIFLLFIGGHVAAQQQLYEVITDTDNKKILKGFIEKKQLSEDADFSWYAETLKYFKPQADAVKAIQEKAGKFQVVLFLGTWCEDSKQLVPKYLATLEAAGIGNDQLTIVGTDRKKQAPANLHKPLGIVNVPTLLVMKDGKELGRIVEYGDGTRADKQLAAIVSGIQ
ncbi:MAG: thioredoxin family protein [Chitinophagaceae bacterium]|jgi:thiol-disulfide isomerase/thioredoxin|nr:thioredoxin family protein [Chitinophagaceae bacterium]